LFSNTLSLCSSLNVRDQVKHKITILCIFIFIFFDWWAMGWTSRVQFSVCARCFPLLHSVQTGSGGYPTFYPMGTRSSFFRGKVAGAWMWSFTSI
jgi:hypothetical protein